MSVQAPSDKRFRRAHVSPTRRRQSWLSDWKHVVGIALGVALAVYVGYQGATLAISPDTLVIQRITVEGNLRMSTGEVESLLEGLRGQNMLTVDLEGWNARLKASPWVADAAIRRVFPGRVAVAVVERAPVGIGRLGEALFLMDRRGNLIDEYGPHYAELDLPILSGLTGGEPIEGPRVDEARAALAVKVVDAMSTRHDLAALISEIDVSDVHNAVLTLKDDATLVRLGEEQFVRRLQAYFDLVPTLRERVPTADYADMRFNNRVYVRPMNVRSTRVQRVGNRPVAQAPRASADAGVPGQSGTVASEQSAERDTARPAGSRDEIEDGAPATPAGG
jgi:cell division septal protein FtsQ